MAKGDDALIKKKNKAIRKKQQQKDGSSAVSARVASIIAAKKRRQSGKRRKCQGMCFSLPTLDDPFNDRHGKDDFKSKKKSASSRVDERISFKGKNARKSKGTLSKDDAEMDHLETRNEKDANLKSDLKKSSISSTEVQLNGKGDGYNHQIQASENLDCPSKFLILCLNAIEKGLQQQASCQNEEDKPLFVDPWGVEFLKCYSVGTDILETSGSSSTVEQIAWMVSIAADAISRKEKQDLPFSSPFLLFLVPSQEQAAKVRLVCKPLKALGIHTVSLHPSASLDHQIHGLRSCEPEFLVSTPERLLELLSLNAVDISGVSFLVVDGLESFYKDGHLEALTSIRQSISGNPYTVVFDYLTSSSCIPAMRNFFPGSIYRFSPNNSIPSQSAGIVQTISVCTSEEDKFLKVIQNFDNVYDNLLHSESLKVLYVVDQDNKSYNLVKLLKLHGYSVTIGSNYDLSDVETSWDPNGRAKHAVSVINAEDISASDLGIFNIVILPDFVVSIDHYVKILIKMARHTIDGVLHSFLTSKDAQLAGPLIEILEQCQQAVPEALSDLHRTSIMPES